MFKQHSDSIRRLGMVALMALVIFLAGSSARIGQATSADATAASPMVIAQVFNVSCPSSIPANTTPAKLTNLATFSVQSPASVVEVTFNGRIFMNSMTGNGTYFELRVDDTASAAGLARALVRSEEVGGGGVPVSISGIFEGLSAGNHTASMWVHTSSGTGVQSLVNPGCFNSDALIVKEYTALGVTFIPSVSR